MAVAEELIHADPALHSALCETRRFVPKHGHEAIVNIELFALAELTVDFQKAASIERAEQLQRRIRAKFFLIRSHCDGWAVEIPGDDGCEHVQAFARRPADFSINRRARAALWYRYAQRPPPPWV